MECKAYYRNGKVVAGLVVTKKELEKIMKEHDCMYVSDLNKEEVSGLKEDDIAGTIFGKINNLIENQGIKDKCKKIENTSFYSNCWFVEKDFVKENYKDLEDPVTRLKIGEAVEIVMQAKYVMSRVNWNGNRTCGEEPLAIRMFVMYVPASKVVVRENTPYGDAGLAGKEIVINGHFDLKTPDGSVQPGWLASQADIQANDWVVYSNESL